MFPTFNIYSSTLLILTIQGIVFSYLLFQRYLKEKITSDLLLAIVLLITSYHQTSYTIGFMDWYDTYPATKINYYLVDLSLLLAPLIFLYIKSTTTLGFKLRNVPKWHFIPVLIYVLFKVVILIYDSNQEGFDKVQNGLMVVNFEWKYLNPIVFLFKTLQMLLYLAFSFQLLFQFREKVKHFFANTYKLELNWLQNFLIAYSLLYLFNSVETVVNEVIIDLSWTQEWWYYLLSGIAIIYVGVKGYFTRLNELQSVEFASYKVPPSKNEIKPKSKIVSHQLEQRKETITAFFDQEKPYLNQELTLTGLAAMLSMSREELSDIINQGFDSRFNDFINGYRIEETKKMISDGKHKSYSLLGLAYEAGFNSKATFNRAFKKAESQSPSEYLESLT